MSLSGAAALRTALEAALASDPAVVLVGEAVGRGGGAQGSTAGLLERFGPERVIDVPVSDRATVALATGLARGGRRPVVELADARRLVAVLEALAAAAASPEVPAPMVVRVPCDEPGPASLTAPLWEALAVAPGLSVAVASDPGAAVGLLRSALAARGPTLLVEPREVYGTRGEIPEGPLALDRARVLRPGTQVTLAGWGPGVGAALDAAESLAADGVSAGVVDLVAIAPLDAATLAAQVRATGRLVVVDCCGPAGLALQAGTREAFLHLEAPPALAPADPAALVAAVLRAIRF